MEVFRNFNGSEAYLLETAITLRGLFEIDLVQFSAFSTQFNATYLADFQTAIDNVFAFGTDETLQDQQAQLTNDVMAELRKCNQKYVEMKFFAERAFPGNTERHNEFGTDDYQKARRNQAQMLVFMDTMHAVAQRYKVQLIAAGATQAKIDEILTLKQSYETANRLQEIAIKQRSSAARERTILQNTLYGFVETVNSAAQIVFYDNEAKKGAYVYLPSTSDGSTIREGIAGPNSTNLVAEVPYRDSRNITFINIGAELLYFGLSNQPTSIEGTVVGVPAGEAKTLSSNELFEGGTFIVCKNDGLNTSTYKVEYDN
jgi:hypothetical protein